MKHAATRELYAYWDRIRGDRLAPERAEIDPTAIRSVLADCFMLEVDAAGTFPFRLAGTRLCALMGRELKDESFATLWQSAGGRAADGTALVRTVCDETQGAVAGVLAMTTGGDALDLELLLLPLRHGGKTHARVLGCLSPASIPSWFGLSPVESLALRSFRVIRGRPGADAFGPMGGTPPSMSLLAQRRGHLRVFEGGAEAMRAPS